MKASIRCQHGRTESPALSRWRRELQIPTFVNTLGNHTRCDLTQMVGRVCFFKVRMPYYVRHRHIYFRLGPQLICLKIACHSFLIIHTTNYYKHTDSIYSVWHPKAFWHEVYYCWYRALIRYCENLWTYDCRITEGQLSKVNLTDYPNIWF